MKALSSIALFCCFLMLAACGAAKLSHLDYEIKQKAEALVSLTSHIDLEQAKDLIKVALNERYSDKPKDRDLVICRYKKKLGSHRYTLFCNTNGWFSNEAVYTAIHITRHQTRPQAQ